MAEQRGSGGPAHIAGPLAVDETAAAERAAARLEVTPKRVIEALAAIAFADIREIVGWDDGQLTMTASGKLHDADAAAIAEIIASAKESKIYRVKLHDKTAALSLLSRLLGMQKNAGPNEDEPTEHDGKTARDFIIRELDRIAAERGQRSIRPEAER
jgi:hypothetical protein